MRCGLGIIHEGRLFEVVGRNQQCHHQHQSGSNLRVSTRLALPSEVSGDPNVEVGAGRPTFSSSTCVESGPPN
jgi:hypothetical protein